MKKIKSITVGADPEMFLVDTSINEIICAKGIIPGKKDKPYKKGLPKGFGVQVDGILAEFNIPPCSSKTEYLESILFMKDWIRNYIKNKNPNLDILCKSSTIVSDNCISDPEVNIRGCDSDYNAYTQEINPRVDGYPDNHRCAGFHTHFGTPVINSENITTFIKYCDLCIGLPSVFVDTDQERRKLYGKAGCFRQQEFGCEYRSLGATMLNDDYLSNIWDSIERTIEFYNEQIPLPESDLIQKCINTSNQILANHIIKLYKEQCVELLG